MFARTLFMTQNSKQLNLLLGARLNYDFNQTSGGLSFEGGYSQALADTLGFRLSLGANINGLFSDAVMRPLSPEQIAAFVPSQNIKDAGIVQVSGGNFIHSDSFSLQAPVNVQLLWSPNSWLTIAPKIGIGIAWAKGKNSVTVSGHPAKCDDEDLACADAPIPDICPESNACADTTKTISAGPFVTPSDQLSLLLIAGLGLLFKISPNHGILLDVAYQNVGGHHAVTGGASYLLAWDIFPTQTVQAETEVSKVRDQPPPAAIETPKPQVPAAITPPLAPAVALTPKPIEPPKIELAPVTVKPAPLPEEPKPVPPPPAADVPKPEIVISPPPPAPEVTPPKVDEIPVPELPERFDQDYRDKIAALPTALARRTAIFLTDVFYSVDSSALGSLVTDPYLLEAGKNDPKSLAEAITAFLKIINRTELSKSYYDDKINAVIMLRDLLEITTPNNPSLSDDAFKALLKKFKNPDSATGYYRGGNTGVDNYLLFLIRAESKNLPTKQQLEIFRKMPCLNRLIDRVIEMTNQ